MDSSPWSFTVNKVAFAVIAAVLVCVCVCAWLAEMYNLIWIAYVILNIVTIYCTVVAEGMLNAFTFVLTFLRHSCGRQITVCCSLVNNLSVFWLQPVCFVTKLPQKRLQVWLLLFFFKENPHFQNLLADDKCSVPFSLNFSFSHKNNTKNNRIAHSSCCAYLNFSLFSDDEPRRKDNNASFPLSLVLLRKWPDVRSLVLTLPPASRLPHSNWKVLQSMNYSWQLNLTVLYGGCKQRAKNPGVVQRFPVTYSAKMLHWNPGWKKKMAVI